ncbi:hypothetical protein [Paenibacillus sp. HB172176]|uniref:hypothetical protein n=1 Tax=Paenibacillus sp. HB172176 TaxID=2493690 RepID=UPI00143B747B|nr:hypothetical protein [Paenibacillus sp. HB172176]
MQVEQKNVKFLIDGERRIYGQLFLYEESPDDEDMVLLEAELMGKEFKFKSESFFSALIALRRELEKEGIQILCNGSARKVYPSRMQLSMGSGRLAYILTMGQQAKSSDMVDIFDYDDEFEFVAINKQVIYYNEWLNSIILQK